MIHQSLGLSEANGGAQDTLRRFGQSSARRSGRRNGSRNGRKHAWGPRAVGLRHARQIGNSLQKHSSFNANSAELLAVQTPAPKVRSSTAKMPPLHQARVPVCVARNCHLWCWPATARSGPGLQCIATAAVTGRTSLGALLCGRLRCPSCGHRR